MYDAKMTITKAILHILALYLMGVIYCEQYRLISDLSGDANVLHSPYLSGLLVYYSITFMRRSELIVALDRREKKIVIYLAPLFVLLLACLNFVSANITLNLVISIIDAVIFPEFVLAFIFSFEPNTKQGYV
jgi:hypothetical protein